jgi:hypothetical protein
MPPLLHNMVFSAFNMVSHHPVLLIDADIIHVEALFLQR